MSHRVQVLEYSKAPVEGGVIRGVKIVGTRSKNGRVYPQAVLNAAIPLYEASAVYVWHPDVAEKKRNSRRHDDYFGHLLNIHERFDGKIGLGLFGDLHVRQSHPMAQMIVESDGRQFGLSHNVVCEMNDEETEVTRILEVNSVDLVDDPATNKNLFEETDDMAELAELKAAADASSARIEAMEGKLDAILESTKAPNPDELAAKVKELESQLTVAKAAKKRVALLEKADVIEDEPTIGNTYEDFLGALHGFPVTNQKDSNHANS